MPPARPRHSAVYAEAAEPPRERCTEVGLTRVVGSPQARTVAACALFKVRACRAGAEPGDVWGRRVRDINPGQASHKSERRTMGPAPRRVRVGAVMCGRRGWAGSICSVWMLACLMPCASLLGPFTGHPLHGLSGGGSAFSHRCVPRIAWQRMDPGACSYLSPGVISKSMSCTGLLGLVPRAGSGVNQQRCCVPLALGRRVLPRQAVIRTRGRTSSPDVS